ncbi:hypothetical protein BKM31_36080 [[Actinomadura] parvosata subsp. kistnae]|uniref:Uncharacterized protein n=1 Tax=[Actinomadura] parvosata subsp. kistnae TaxID=1909395 RepID=A0A1V0A7G8_9ACTN|nr:hypothetical protein BKM31_36080 [Nonomuraea sp. ATCC 55076]
MTLRLRMPQVHSAPVRRATLHARLATEGLALRRLAPTRPRPLPMRRTRMRPRLLPPGRVPLRPGTLHVRSVTARSGRMSFGVLRLAWLLLTALWRAAVRLSTARPRRGRLSGRW